MNIFTTESSLLIRSLGWTLLHSLWQGALVAICLWIVLKTVSTAAARIKYHLSLSALLLIAGWFTITWIQQWQRLKLLTVVVTEAGKGAGLEKTYTLNALPQQGPTELWIEHWFPNMDAIFPWIVSLYILGMFVMLLRFTVGFSKLLQFRYRGITQPETELTDWLLQLKEKLGINKNVRLMLSSHIIMPMMIGVLKPLILLPFSMTTALTTLELEAILLHELAHIKRQDFLVNILQIIIETILFFNPFMWWISAGIRREREHCCDDLVISHTLQPLPYAKALATLEANRFAAGTFAMAAAGRKHHLFHRIKRITEMKKTQLNYGRFIAALLMVGLLTFSLVWFTPGFAQTNKDKKKGSAKAEVQNIVYIDENGARHEYDSDNMPPAIKEQLKQIMKDAPVVSESPKSGTKDTSDVQAYTFQYVDEDEHQTSYDENGDPVCNVPAKQQTVVSWDADRTRDAAARQKDLKAVYNKIRTELKDVEDVDWEQMEKQFEQADKQLAMAGVQVKDAMNNVDWEYVNKEVNAAMNSVDWKAINQQMKDAEKQMKEAQKQMRKDIKQVDWDRVNKQMDEAQKRLKDARKQVSRASKGYGATVPMNGFGSNWDYNYGNGYTPIAPVAPTAPISPIAPVAPISPTAPLSPIAPISPIAPVAPLSYSYSTNGARAYVNGKPYYNVRVNRNGTQLSATVMPNINSNVRDIKKSSARNTKTSTIVTIGGIEELNEMLKEMEADGLIEKDGTFKISKKDGSLFINGKEQPETVLNKYSSHFKVARASISGTRNHISYATN